MKFIAKLIPGVYYGSEDDGSKFKVLISLEERALLREMRIRGVQLENTLYNLNIDGLSKNLAVARTVQIDPSK